MKAFTVLAIPLVLALALLAGCAPGNKAPAVAPESASSASKEISPSSAEGWQVKWDNLLKEAKKEGILSMYSTGGGEIRDAIIKPIQEKLGLKLEFITGKGAEVSQRLISERRSGIYLADVYIGGSTTILTQLKPAGMLDPMEKDIFLPEALDPKAWYGGGLKWKDKDRSAISFITFAVPPLTINTTLVKPDEIKSYKDLLNPKWKGKIILNDPTVAGVGLRFFLIAGGIIMGHDYMRELVKQEPLILRDQRQQVEWVAQGKYAIVVTTKPEIVADFVKAGAPLAHITPSEGMWTSAGSGNLALINRAPHPRAAQAFINWVLTRDAQILFSKAYGAPSARTDVPTEGLDPATLVKPGIKYIEGDAEEIELGSVEQRKLAVEIFGPLMK